MRHIAIIAIIALLLIQPFLSRGDSSLSEGTESLVPETSPSEPSIDDLRTTTATITVGKSGSPDHSTIGAAVTAAGNGDTIQVWAGTYNENVVIPSGKTLNIFGAGKTQTIIDGGDSGTVVTVNANGCTIKDMKITGSGTAAGCSA